MSDLHPKTVDDKGAVPGQVHEDPEERLQPVPDALHPDPRNPAPPRPAPVVSNPDPGAPK